MSLLVGIDFAAGLVVVVQLILMTVNLPHPIVVVVPSEKLVLPSVVVVLTGMAVVEPCTRVVVQEVVWDQIC
jgi:hypothetical protein